MSVTFGPKKGYMISAADGDAFGTYFRTLLRGLDTFLLPYVIDHTLATPPGSPANGAAYIVAASPTGAWAGKATNVAVWSTDNPSAPSGEWEFYPPENGWIVYSRASSGQLAWNGSAWSSIGSGATTFTGLTDVPGSYSGAGGKAVEVNSGATALIFNAKPFDVSCFAAGIGTASQKLLRVALARAVTFPASAALSQAVASAAATGSTVFTLSKNGSSFATVTFAASASTGTWVQASDAVFAAGDVLEIDGPGSPDASLADVGITLAGIRA